MDIKELYITDLNAGSDEFWSEDKINKLNENFNKLKRGLIQGPPGDIGPLGAAGAAGATGAAGAAGITGIAGVDGYGGVNIWERLISTKVRVRPRLNTSCVILGFASSATAITQPAGGDATFVDAGKSSLRIHAVDRHGTTTQRNHIELNSTSTDAAASSAYINFKLDAANSNAPTARIHSKKIHIGASNTTVVADGAAILALTDGGIVINPGTGTLAFSGDGNVIGGVTVSHLATDYSASTLYSAWDVSADTTVYVIDPGGTPWPSTGTITITGETTNVVTYSSIVYQTGYYELTVANVSADTNSYVAGNGVTIPHDDKVGFTVAATSTYTAGNATDIQFTDASNTFVSPFPYGSIISISPDEYFANFLNDYTEALNDTGSYESGGQGYESSHGRGFGNYGGWYLCNGRKWQTVHAAGENPSFSEEILKLNRTSYDINGTNIPDAVDDAVYSVTGSTLDIVSNDNTLIINSTSNDSGAELGIARDVGIWYHSIVTGKRNVNNKIFVVYLGRDDLYWYTDAASGSVV